MNFKTTLFLAAVLACLGIVYFWSPAANDVSTPVLPDPSATPSGVSRRVLDEELGDVVKVACKLKGKQEEWVFERQPDEGKTDTKVWHLTSPNEMKVASWEVDRFARELGRLEYEISYKPGEAGALSAADAGLDPPQAVVTLVDDKGASAIVEVGHAAPSNGTFVRLAGDDAIRVGTSSLKNLFKPSLLDYRDRQVWSFDAANVTKVEVVDRSDAAGAKRYALVRGDSGWMLEAPVTARASSKVDDVLKAMSRLRSTGWIDDNAERLAAYGLEPAAYAVTATVEEQVPVARQEEAPDAVDAEEAESEVPSGEIEEGQEGADAKDEAEPNTTTKVTTYTLQLSERSPIGEDTKIFMRVGDEAMVGTIGKSVADKFKPVMSEWRDMKLTSVNVADASQIRMSAGGGSATLVKRGATWEFAEDGGRAEESAVTELLDAIGALTAVAYLDGPVTDPAQFGLEEPQAQIELTIPGVENVETITVGAYSDGDTKRLVYVRRNQVASVGKVQVASTAKLTRPLIAYRDRTIVNLPARRVDRVVLEVENPLAPKRSGVTLERVDGEWALTVPVSAPAQSDRVKKLVESLADLSAESIVADAGALSAYGLHDPKARIALTYRPPPEYRIKDARGEDEDEGENDNAPVEVQQPSETIELIATAHDGRFYAKRADRPTIYEINGDSYAQMLQEYRDGTVFAFDESSVKSFTIGDVEKDQKFSRVDGGWAYEAEPDLPLDSAKVENLLLQLKDLRIDHFVDYASSDVDSYGLVDPFRRVTVESDDGTQLNLVVSRTTCPADPSKGHYAALSDKEGVFLLTPEEIARFQVSLGDLEANKP